MFEAVLVIVIAIFEEVEGGKDFSGRLRFIQGLV